MMTFSHIKDLVGAWTGRNSLWFEPGTPAIESTTSATITTVAGGKVVTFDYTWTHEGERQDGRLLLSVDAAEGVHMAWCDSFHMDTKIMDLAGDAGRDVIAASGTYQVVDSDPWGWRIELEPQGADALQMRMFNILPRSMGGMESPAVQADYTRASATLMNVQTPEGWHSITPRLVVHDPSGLVDFLKGAFEASGDFHSDRPSEVTIGDSVVMVTGIGVRDPMPAFLYLYVRDADAAYQRAIALGAEALEEPLDTPYGDRRGMVKDPYGNVWQIATRLSEA